MNSTDTATNAFTPVGKLPTQTTEPSPVVETTVSVQSSLARSSGWLHTNLRNLLGIGICGMVCWLAWEGDTQARAGIIAAFSVLIGMIWGERSALKRPGQDS